MAITDLTKYEIIYNDQVLATLEKGQKCTLKCNGKKMISDVVVRKVKQDVQNLIYVLDNETTTYTFNVGNATKFSDLSFPLYSNENSSVWLEASIGHLSIRGEMTEEMSSYVYFEEVTTSFDDVVPLSANIIYEYTYLSEMSHGGGSMD